MITVLHLRLVDRILKHDLRNAKLHKTNQGSNFLRGTFSNTDNAGISVQYRQDRYPSLLLKYDFSLGWKPT